MAATAAYSLSGWSASLTYFIKNLPQTTALAPDSKKLGEVFVNADSGMISMIRVPAETWMIPLLVQ
jgi:hypothetical protein